MLRGVRPWLAFVALGLALISSAARSAAAQELPDYRSLERVGLSMSWWGRAVVDASQDEIEFLIPDEQVVIAQSRQGLLTAFRNDTGRALWSVLLGRPGIRAFPAATNESEVIVTIGLHMYSLDKATGVIRWQLRVPNHPSCTPEIDDRMVYVGCVDGSTYAYDLRTIRNLFSERKLPEYSHNAQVWRYKTPDTVISVASDGHTVNFVSIVGALYGVDAPERSLKYQIETNDRVETPMGRSRDALYLASEDSRMLAVNVSNGRTRWAFTSGAPIIRQPRVVGGQVFVSPIRSGMFCLDAATGGELWRQREASKFLAAGEKRLYALDDVGNLAAVDRASGRLAGRIPMRAFSVLAGNELTDRVYVATSTGLVVCLHEQGKSFPTYYRHPERRPILPEFAPEEGVASPEADDSGDDLTN
ncbi:MAG: PQQ-like beta-propeller repeat protein [Planctomyces sp.]|nr:PQQ-like beta-propeller repeat protein [Planctomyces sp.]